MPLKIVFLKPQKCFPTKALLLKHYYRRQGNLLHFRWAKSRDSYRRLASVAMPSAPGWKVPQRVLFWGISRTWLGAPQRVLFECLLALFGAQKRQKALEKHCLGHSEPGA